MYFITFLLIILSGKKEKSYQYLLKKIIEQEEKIIELNEAELNEIKIIYETNPIFSRYIKNAIDTGRPLVKGDLDLLKSEFEKIKQGHLKKQELEFNGNLSKHL